MQHYADTLLSLYSKSETSCPLPPLNPPLNPDGAPRGGLNEPLLDGRPRPPRGPKLPRLRNPPRPLCLEEIPNVSMFMRISSAHFGLRFLDGDKEHSENWFVSSTEPDKIEHVKGVVTAVHPKTHLLTMNWMCLIFMFVRHKRNMYCLDSTNTKLISTCKSN